MANPRSTRNRFRLAFHAMAMLALLMFLTEREAKAYTDPGSGALIWQMIVAGIVGCSFYVRRIAAWFKNKRQPQTTEREHR